MNDNQDRLMDLALEEAARKNGPPDLKARILSAANGTPAMKLVKEPRHTGPVPRTARLRLMPVYTTMLAAAIIVAVLVNIEFVRDLVTRASSGTGAPSASAGPGTTKSPPLNQPAKEPQPINAPNANEPSNSSGQDGTAPPVKEQPKEQPKPDKPKAEEPRKPDEVEKPDEKKPDGEVEQPKQPEESRPPEKVETPPKEAAVIGSVIGKPKLKMRYAENEAWSEFDGGPLKSGVQLQARGNVDLNLASGALLRFDGEIALAGNRAALECSIIRDSFYIDNRGCKQAMLVVSQKLSAELKDGAALFTATPVAIEIACIEGEVSTGDGIVGAGTIRRLTLRGLGTAKPFTSHRTLADLPGRVLWREDFEKEPAGGLYGGTLADGIASAKGHGEMVAFRFNPTLTALPRMAVKVRLRVGKARRLQLELFEQSENQHPWLLHLAPPQGEWVEITVRFDELRLRDKPQARLSADTLLRNFKLYVEGEKDASLEIDWVEFVRLGPGE